MSAGDDAAFLKMVAQANLAEIAVGKLAVARGSSDAVKQYGQRMIDDHTKANDEVKKLAQSKGITLPTEPDAEHKAMADKLSSLSGAAFDEEFMSGMHADHAKVVAMFQDKAKNATDADVRAFASKTLPTLQQHLQSASALHKNVGR
jgi:putative membrane protein